MFHKSGPKIAGMNSRNVLNIVGHIPPKGAFAMHIGYARTSTLDQVAGFEAQQRDLAAAGCEKVYCEQVSSVAHRTELEAAMEFARDGDCLVVTRLDRLARSVSDLVRITELLAAKGVTLRVLALGLDTATPTGQLMLNLLSAVAQFERQIMLERQREGIAKAKREGKYKGRAPTARRQATAVLALRAKGVSAGDIARKLGLARSSVYRVINAAQPRT